MVNAEAVAHVRALIDDAVGKGARLLAGGAVDGTVMAATVLDRVTPWMLIYGEESFGPVVGIVRAKDDDDAVRIANDTEYGLAAAVFSRDVDRALAVAKTHRVRCLSYQRVHRLRRGAASVRRHQVIRLRPFGGRAAHR